MRKTPPRNMPLPSPAKGNAAGEGSSEENASLTSMYDWTSYENAGFNYGVPTSARPRHLPKFTEGQIAYILQEAGSGTPLDKICRKLGISDASYLAWRRKYGGLLQSEYDRLIELQRENERLKKLLGK